MALSRWMKDKGVTGWLLALTVGRRVCIYRVHRLPFLIPFSIFILRTALERDTEKVERGRGSGGHTHLSQTRPHTGAHILRDGDTPEDRARETPRKWREVAGVEATHTSHRHVHTRGLTSCATETRLCVLCSKRQHISQQSQTASHESIGAVGWSGVRPAGGGDRCAPLGLAAHKLTRLIRIHLLKRGRK